MGCQSGSSMRTTSHTGIASMLASASSRCRMSTFGANGDLPSAARCCASFAALYSRSALVRALPAACISLKISLCKALAARSAWCATAMTVSSVHWLSPSRVCSARYAVLLSSLARSLPGIWMSIALAMAPRARARRSLSLARRARVATRASSNTARSPCEAWRSRASALRRAASSALCSAVAIFCCRSRAILSAVAALSSALTAAAYAASAAVHAASSARTCNATACRW